MAEYPKEITPELKEILGMMVFELSPIAHGFRAAGENIPTRAEDEQAFVLHWLIGLALEHGASWRKIAGTKLQEVLAVAKARDA
jgi:hypothetical protein